MLERLIAALKATLKLAMEEIHDRGVMSTGTRNALSRDMMQLVGFLAVNDEKQIGERRLEEAEKLRKIARNLLNGLNAVGQPLPQRPLPPPRRPLSPPFLELDLFGKHTLPLVINPHLDNKYSNVTPPLPAFSLSPAASSGGAKAKSPVASNIVVQAGNMTGDMFGMAAALALDPTLHVVILSELSPRDKTVDLCKFYLLTLDDLGFDFRDRIHVLQVVDMSRSYTLYSAQRDILPACKPPLPPELCDKKRQKPIGFSTMMVAREWMKDPKLCRREIRRRWRVEDRGVNERVLQFLSKRGIPTGQSRFEKSDEKRGVGLGGSQENLGYVVLWSRFSGKKGGPHAQHDTSFTGMRQLVRLARSYRKTVIITGDHNPSRSSVVKYGELCKDQGVFSIVEFWKDEDWIALFGKDDRTSQFAVYDYLNRCAAPVGNLKHLGFRSGNLEVYAVLGHQIRYMEERANLQEARMVAWSTDNTTKKKPPQPPSTAIGYNRILVHKTPTRTGQWIVENAKAMASEDKPPWILNPLRNKGDFMRPSFVKGFEFFDLIQIESYIADREVGLLMRTHLERELEEMQRDADEQRASYPLELREKIERFNLSEPSSEFDFDDFED